MDIDEKESKILDKIMKDYPEALYASIESERGGIFQVRVAGTDFDDTVEVSFNEKTGSIDRLNLTLDDVRHLKLQLFDHASAATDLAARCRIYCANKELPLEERWDFFVSHAIQKRPIDSSIEFKALDISGNAEGSTLNSLLRQSQAAQKDKRIFTNEPFWEHIGKNPECKIEITEKIINELKEEILESYLDSFVL